MYKQFPCGQISGNGVVRRIQTCAGIAQQVSSLSHGITHVFTTTVETNMSALPIVLSTWFEYFYLNTLTGLFYIRFNMQ